MDQMWMPSMPTDRGKDIATNNKTLSPLLMGWN
jgi:hypothetical protein